MRKYFKNEIIKRAKSVSELTGLFVYFLIKDEEIIYAGKYESDGRFFNVSLPDLEFNRYFVTQCKDEKEVDCYLKSWKPESIPKSKKTKPASYFESTPCEARNLQYGVYTKSGEYFYFNLKGFFKVLVGNQPFMHEGQLYHLTKSFGNLSDCVQ